MDVLLEDCTGGVVRNSVCGFCLHYWCSTVSSSRVISIDPVADHRGYLTLGVRLGTVVAAQEAAEAQGSPAVGDQGQASYNADATNWTAREGSQCEAVTWAGIWEIRGADGQSHAGHGARKAGIGLGYGLVHGHQLGANGRVRGVGGDDEAVAAALDHDGGRGALEAGLAGGRGLDCDGEGWVEVEVELLFVGVNLIGVAVEI